jgi:hypothetical protein
MKLPQRECVIRKSAPFISLPRCVGVADNEAGGGFFDTHQISA